ncbi:hypothetical protein [Actinobacillus equuli]|uniref:hypothetical protein n=1 Tax=Actinobacillus equuli TaxID=718 RepID=UPI0024423E1F|nr:hypothetical protein [Actinobacillus equuli]WGE51695.1 hypothetical protein NYR68_04740 [Actinobacillus equuli subsp. haemolyticus]WGE59977.1 hypothetical protein NYR73_04520 [Actinobacillus equuli subsp. haemolyticus]WGE61377.1 hypothetical protein NYR74_00930 [Actinobacillus equuli subsp. haemolyticus]
MKKIIKISKLFGLISICCSFNSFASKGDVKYYLNSKNYFFSDIDVDKDGVRDKIISNVNGLGDELLFFKKT